MEGARSKRWLAVAAALTVAGGLLWAQAADQAAEDRPVTRQEWAGLQLRVRTLERKMAEIEKALGAPGASDKARAQAARNAVAEIAGTYMVLQDGVQPAGAMILRSDGTVRSGGNEGIWRVAGDTLYLTLPHGGGTLLRGEPGQWVGVIRWRERDSRVVIWRQQAEKRPEDKEEGGDDDGDAAPKE